MSEVTPLAVTVELPASELLDHDNGLFVRCPANRTWVPLTDYYSEVAGQLLPLVGKVDYAESTEHWDVKLVESKDVEGKVIKVPELDPKTGLPVMIKVAKENTVVWKEVVRILPAEVAKPAEGGTLEFNTDDSVEMKDKF